MLALAALSVLAGLAYRRALLMLEDDLAVAEANVLQFPPSDREASGQRRGAAGIEISTNCCAAACAAGGCEVGSGAGGIRRGLKYRGVWQAAPATGAGAVRSARPAHAAGG